MKDLPELITRYTGNFSGTVQQDLFQLKVQQIQITD